MIAASLFQKAYKELFNRQSATEKGTLYYFKCILRRKDINGQVKNGGYREHSDLLLVRQFFLIYMTSISK